MLFVWCRLLRGVFEKAEASDAGRNNFAPFELSPVMRAVGDTLKRVADQLEKDASGQVKLKTLEDETDR